MSVAQAAQMLAARGHACTVRGLPSTVFASVSNDTRTLEAGALYVALRGARFDGHDFCRAAAERGAVALLVERPHELALPQIVVDDSARALGGLAAGWRAQLRLPLVAVAGSNGKTTTTQMIASVLQQAFGPAPGAAGAPRWLATRGNRNNEIGVPLTLLELRAGHRAAVVELGMNHPGEIGVLSAWAQPTVAVVTNAQREHQEFLDTVEATARENGAVIAALPPDGTAVFPAEDGCAPIWRALAGARRVLDFALGDAPAALRGSWQDGRLRIDGPGARLDVELAIAGEHNARNALAAASACLAIGIDGAAIAAGLAAFRPVAGRGVQLRASGGATLIDDSYNANPDSMRAAIDLLAAQPGRRVLVMGDMGEVGARGPQFHAEVGAYARARGIDRLLAAGPLSASAVEAFGAGARHCAGVDELVEAARAELAAAGPMGPAAVLVKASRFMGLERVVAALAAGPAAAAVPAGPGGHA